MCVIHWTKESELHSKGSARLKIVECLVTKNSEREEKYWRASKMYRKSPRGEGKGIAKNLMCYVSMGLS